MTQQTLGSFFSKISAQNAKTIIDQTADANNSGESDAELEVEDSHDTEDHHSPDLTGPDSDEVATNPNSKSSTSNSTCTCQCCAKPETPYHPS